ncbi:hypothetical protein T492DRAFT_1043235 [Pavlovales sp. CCMP2436]|nr:hypothetical protein T492DRAFT_1043235 [Pavlovales sp. CCMP2436]|mmetsp:Transcript_7293/g.19002  ORF Transcript_7293/g.19002 Transcript_7293/m.19002 type:complete len:156 (-) Transcript_7293:109-576(-)
MDSIAALNQTAQQHRRRALRVPSVHRRAPRPRPQMNCMHQMADLLRELGFIELMSRDDLSRALQCLRSSEDDMAGFAIEIVRYRLSKRDVPSITECVPTTPRRRKRAISLLPLRSILKRPIPWPEKKFYYGDHFVLFSPPFSPTRWSPADDDDVL